MIQQRTWLEMTEHLTSLEYKDWFKFAMVWFSFNNYYEQKYNKIRKEKDKVIAFAKDNEEYYNTSFFNETIIEEFKTMDSDGKKKSVRNMKKENDVVYFDDDHKSVEDFFKVLYQIRCNFFHGDKQPDNPYDRELIKWAAKNLTNFLRGVHLDE